MRKKYGALRVISGLYKILAVIVLLLAVLGAIAVVVFGASLISQFGSGVTNMPLVLLSIGAQAIGILLGGAITAISLYAFGNLIDLMLATEENTRMTAILLNRLGRRLQRAARPPQARSAPPPTP